MRDLGGGAKRSSRENPERVRKKESKKLDRLWRENFFM